VVEKSLEVEESKPAKRKVIHFMQPHAPYITEEGFDGFMDVISGSKSIDDLRDAYIRNIEVVLPEVERLAEEMEGRVVVTADHGELLGEYGMFSHPYGLRAKELREVPWHVISDGEKETKKPSELDDIDF
jgi:hypothetical protein